MGFRDEFAGPTRCRGGVIMTPDLWQEWQRNWRWMEQLAFRNGWEVTPLRIDPPASETEVAALEGRHGLEVPPQLRAILTGYSSSVQFGWGMPNRMHTLDEWPYFGGLRDSVWDIAHIDEYAIDNFRGWRRRLAHRAECEEPNSPEMWEGQFPIAHLNNGDMLTIDASSPGGPQPVRYFSHDLEGLHGRAIAPDFVTFVTEYTMLGCAGMTHDDWFQFVEKLDDNRHYVRAGSNGGRAWRAWLAHVSNR
jgi:hypothetical protein